jgi:isopenicillin N synthase-like dioxygenase
MDVRTVKYTEENAPSIFTQSLHQTGFSILKNHPIDPSLISDVYEEWSMFFSNGIKEKYLFNKNTQDGFFPFKSENAKGNPNKDLKEFFHFYPWGIFPEELSSKTKTLFNQLILLTETLLGWIEKESPENVKILFSMPLPDMIDSSRNNLLRIIHYPPLKKNEDRKAMRGAAHEDINLITLLVSGTEPGLQVKDNNGKWHSIICDPGSIAVNTGDMLREVSQGYFPSTTHKVINPKSTEENISRYSMPLFLHPKSTVRLSKKYIAEEYLNERLNEIGLK